MTSEQLRDFKKDLEKLKAHFDKKFGKGNYGIVTEEFPIAAKYTIINSKGKPE